MARVSLSAQTFHPRLVKILQIHCSTQGWCFPAPSLYSQSHHPCPTSISVSFWASNGTDELLDSILVESAKCQVIQWVRKGNYYSVGYRNTKLDLWNNNGRQEWRELHAFGVVHVFSAHNLRHMLPHHGNIINQPRSYCKR